MDAETPSPLSRVEGCLIGLAVGDALGAPVEFMSAAKIQKEFGPGGIDDFFAWEGFPPGSITDDTQMSLATAWGLLDALTRFREQGRYDPVAAVHGRYLEWLATQKDPFQQRAPGDTCLSALRSGRVGTVESPINRSKGCGGVMRVAPVGLVADENAAFDLGCRMAAVTHGHPGGYLPGGALALIIHRLFHGAQLGEALDAALETLSEYKGHDSTSKLLSRAGKLAGSPRRPAEAIPLLGEGWVGDEALAIAMYCALKFPGDFARAARAGANHGGDSDSTASICGAVLGVHLGRELIPAQWAGGVEGVQGLEALAESLHETFVEKKVRLGRPPG